MLHEKIRQLCTTSVPQQGGTLLWYGWEGNEARWVKGRGHLFEPKCSAATSFVDFKDFKAFARRLTMVGLWVLYGFIMVLSYSLSRQPWMTTVHTTRQVSTCSVGVSMAWGLAICWWEFLVKKHIIYTHHYKVHMYRLYTYGLYSWTQTHPEPWMCQKYWHSPCSRTILTALEGERDGFVEISNLNKHGNMPSLNLSHLTDLCTVKFNFESGFLALQKESFISFSKSKWRIHETNQS